MRHICLALLAVLLLTGSSRAQTIGFAQVGSESGWRRAFSDDVQAEASRRGIHLLFNDADNDVEHQRAAIRGFIAARVQAIILAPVVVAGWTEVLREVRAAGIPMFIVDREVDADPSLFVARIAADFNLEGRLAGAWLAQAAHGTCDIVEIQGTEGSGPAIQRHKGFLAGISEFPAIRILRSVNGGFTRDGGYRAMSNLIETMHRLQGVCAVWSHNDDMLLGAIEAMQQAGLSPGRGILTVSVDGVPDIYRAMLAGTANMSVELRSDIGRYIFDVVQAYLAGRHDNPKWVVIPTSLHTAADAEEMLAHRSH